MSGQMPFTHARWRPAVRQLGQAQASSITVMVTRDGAPAPGVPVEVMFQNGNTKAGVTDTAGKYVAPFGAPEYGQTVVRITPPVDVEDLGEGTAQGIMASATPATVSFALTSLPVPASGSPILGAAVALGLLGLVTFGMGGR